MSLYKVYINKKELHEAAPLQQKQTLPYFLQGSARSHVFIYIGNL